MKEGDFQLPFQSGDLPAHSRLAELEQPTRARETAGLDNDVEDAQSVPIHRLRTDGRRTCALGDQVSHGPNPAAFWPQNSRIMSSPEGSEPGSLRTRPRRSRTPI